MLEDITIQGLLGQHFSDGIIRVEKYLDLLLVLHEELNNNPLFAGKPLHLQQGDAPPHYSVAVGEFLDLFSPIGLAAEVVLDDYGPSI